jgi:2,3,4,5-tetrahydropyridine-2-carboxylate N-succinyltransferase
MNLQECIENLFAPEAKESGEECFQAFDELKAALNEGRVRAAEPDPTSPTGWKVNEWVKKGILLGFRIGRIVEMPGEPSPVPLRGTPSPKGRGLTSKYQEAGLKAGATARADARVGERSALPREAVGLPYQFRDKHTFPLKQIPVDRNIRIVPGGSAIRDGCYIGKGVVCMPPMYVNVGAYVDDDTMIDSHALVGSCAQVGKRVHLSAAAQIGGVLEPIGALPVIVEDDVLVGGNCGVYEGCIVGAGAVLAAGTILTGSTPVYDLVRDTVYRREGDKPLMIPAGAVVVPGARAVTRGRGKELGLSLYTPVIIKYRDDKTDQATRLEELLR